MEEIEVFDLKRMLVGDFSLAFTLEVVVRTAIMYAYTVAIVRLLGKRGMSQLAPFELVIIIALGSAVGDPMLYPDVPLLHGIVVITAVVALHSGLTAATTRWDRFEHIIESEPVCVVSDGSVDVEALSRERLHPEELFEALREQGYENLGDIRQAYLEPSGRVSVFPFEAGEERPGLPLVPPPGGILAGVRLGAEGEVLEPGYQACLECGHTMLRRAGETADPCPVCGQTGRWTRARRRRRPAPNGSRPAASGATFG